MTRLALGLAFLALPLATAVEPFVVLLDWREGHSLVGTTVLVMSPAAERFPFDVDACHRNLLLDLLYDPQELEADVPGVGEFATRYEFLVEIWHADERVSQQRVRTSNYGVPLGVTAAAGEHELRLSLANGANVDWALRVRGRSIQEELACYPRVVVNEVEANPAGIDRGNEWVELYNADPIEEVDLSAWVLRSTHGVTNEWKLPGGTLLAPGARLQVVFAGGQFLDNEAESVELVDFSGLLRDKTPMASDSTNDGRTWQRTSDGGSDWLFAAGTPP